MPDSAAGDLLQFREHGMEISRVLVRQDGASSLVINAGWNPGYPLVEYFRSKDLPAYRTSALVKPRSVEVEAAALALLAAVDPAEARELEQAPWKQVFLHGSYSRGEDMSRTRKSFRIRNSYHEFDSGDMVRMDHDWRWTVLVRPLLVIGLYIGDRGKGLQVCSEAVVPAEAVDAFLKAASA